MRYCVFQPSTWSHHEYKYCNRVLDSKECSLYGALGSEVGDLCSLPVCLISLTLLGVGGGSVQLWHTNSQTTGRFGPVWEIFGAAQRGHLLQGAGKKDRILYGGETNSQILKQTEPSLRCRGQTLSCRGCSADYKYTAFCYFKEGNIFLFWMLWPYILKSGAEEMLPALKCKLAAEYVPKSYWVI